MKHIFLPTKTVYLLLIVNWKLWVTELPLPGTNMRWPDERGADGVATLRDSSTMGRTLPLWWRQSTQTVHTIDSAGVASHFPQRELTSRWYNEALYENQSRELAKENHLETLELNENFDGKQNENKYTMARRRKYVVIVVGTAVFLGVLAGVLVLSTQGKSDDKATKIFSLEELEKICSGFSLVSPVETLIQEPLFASCLDQSEVLVCSQEDGLASSAIGTCSDLNPDFSCQCNEGEVISLDGQLQNICSSSQVACNEFGFDGEDDDDDDEGEYEGEDEDDDDRFVAIRNQLGLQANSSEMKLESLAGICLSLDAPVLVVLEPSKDGTLLTQYVSCPDEKVCRCPPNLMIDLRHSGDDNVLNKICGEVSDSFLPCLPIDL